MPMKMSPSSSESSPLLLSHSVAPPVIAPPPQCLLCANSCLVLFCCLCQAPWWTIDCSSGWVQPQHLSSFLSSFPHPVFCMPLPVPPTLQCCKDLPRGLSLVTLPPPLLILCAPSLLPLPPLLHHCCLMPACMMAANWSHRWTEKLRFRAESQTNQMLLNDDVPATFNRHFCDSLYLLSLSLSFFFFLERTFRSLMIALVLFLWLCSEPGWENRKLFQSCSILLHVRWWQLWALLFYL